MAPGLFRKIQDGLHKAIKIVQKYGGGIYKPVSQAYDVLRPILKQTPVAPFIPIMDTTKRVLDPLLNRSHNPKHVVQHKTQQVFGTSDAHDPNAIGGVLRIRNKT